MRSPQFSTGDRGGRTDTKILRVNVDRHDLPHQRWIKVPRDLLRVNLVTSVGNIAGRNFVWRRRHDSDSTRTRQVSGGSVAANLTGVEDPLRASPFQLGRQFFRPEGCGSVAKTPPQVT